MEGISVIIIIWIWLFRHLEMSVKIICLVCLWSVCHLRNHALKVLSNGCVLHFPQSRRWIDFWIACGTRLGNRAEGVSGQPQNRRISEESWGGFVWQFNSFVLPLFSCSLEHLNENKCCLSWQSREAASSLGSLEKNNCLWSAVFGALEKIFFFLLFLFGTRSWIQCLPYANSTLGILSIHTAAGKTI